MSMRSLRQIFIVAFSLSLSSLALARNPPALVSQQKASAGATRAGGGYRDLNWRFGVVPARSPEVMRSAGGYRDINYRFPGASVPSNRTASQAGASRWR